LDEGELQRMLSNLEFLPEKIKELEFEVLTSEEP